MGQKFQIIIADPCWSFLDSLTMSDVPRGAAANYPLMSNSDIKNLPIKEIADPEGCVLALWVPSSLLPLGLEVMKAWGFELKQTFIWCKIKKKPLDKFIKSNKPKKITIDNFKQYIKQTFINLIDLKIETVLNFGMGRLFRQTHEIALIGTNNNKIYKLLENKSQRSVCFAPNFRHSQKPNDLHESLEIMFPSILCSKIEIFARKQRKKWLCLGNEAPMTKDEDIRISLKKLINIEDNKMFPINKLISSYDEEKNKELFEMWSKISSDK